MKSVHVKIWFSIILVLGCIGCVGPGVKIDKDKIYEQPAPLPSTEYLLGPGDVLEVFFSFETKPTTELYRLAVGDIIRVEFNYHKELNRELTIQPDGRIVLPFEGEIVAGGLTPAEMDQKITRLFSKRFKDPIITVTLLEFNQTRVQFQDAIRSEGRGQSRLVKIMPDGYVTFPLINNVKAMGLTVPQLRQIIADKYVEKLSNIEVSLMLEQANSNLVYVIGEVERQDYFKMESPTSVSQILSRSGIILETAAINSILVISRTDDNRPIGRIFNFEDVLSHGNIGKDFLLKQYDVVYVPKTKISRVGVFVDQYINNLVPQFFRMSLGYTYDINKD